MIFSKNEIKTLLKNKPPGLEAHQEVSPLSRKKIDYSKLDVSQFRRSSVAIVLYPENNTLKSILIQRSIYNGTHSGQISFPGGKVENFDSSILDTSIRECQEETAVVLSKTDFIGNLSEVFIPVSNFHIEPCVFYLDNTPSMKRDEREVQQIINFEIEQLFQENVIRHKSLKISERLTIKEVPYFLIENHIVWGATALILNEFRHLIKTRNVL